MKILSVKIEGFRSIIAPMKYKLDRPGINIILGKNGFGKTTIFDAIAWAQYGKLLKEGSSEVPWPLVIPDDFRGTKVRVKYDGGFEIIRCSNYMDKVHGIKGGNKIFIIEDGKLNNIRDKRDNQKYINQKLGYSFELFKSSVLFAQELKRLIQEDGPAKKRIFEEAFESTFILKAKDAVETKLDELTTEDRVIYEKANKYITLFRNNTELLEEMQKQAKEFYQKKGLAISALRAKVKQSRRKITEAKKYIKGGKLKISRASLERLIDQRDNIKKQINGFLIEEEFRLEMDKTRYGTELEKLKKEFKVWNGAKIKKNICSECKQILKGEALKKHRQYIKIKFDEIQIMIKETDSLFIATTNRQDELKEQIKKQKDFKAQVLAIEVQMNKLSGKIGTIEKYKTEVALEKVLIKEWVSSIQVHQDSKLTQNTDKIQASIGKFKTRSDKYQAKLTKLREDIEIQNWLLKDPLSNSGLKAYIFDSMMGKVNYFLKKYTNFIGFTIKVKMDLKSSNKDFNILVEKGDFLVPYEDLSKGEKQLAEVALCFSLNDVVTMNKPINILLMDEIFESLDPDNIEIVGNIVQQKSLNRSIHLITHQSLFQPTNCYKTFVTKNDKGQTLIDQKYRAA